MDGRPGCGMSVQFKKFGHEAASSKDLVPVMVVICREFTSGTEADEHRLAAYVCLDNQDPQGRQAELVGERCEEGCQGLRVLKSALWPLSPMRKETQIKLGLRVFVLA